jgi:hypothetical protein
MPRLTANKDEVKGLPPVPEGMYTVRCDGFKPKFSKDKSSINLNPIFKITNDQVHNDRQIFDNLNTKAKWIWKDFCHCFGVPMQEDTNGDFEFPGNFVGPDDNPEAWQYAGPVVGQLGQIYVIQSEYNGQANNKIKFYVCKLALANQCTEKHSANLVKS